MLFSQIRPRIVSFTKQKNYLTHCRNNYYYINKSNFFSTNNLYNNNNDYCKSTNKYTNSKCFFLTAIHNNTFLNGYLYSNNIFKYRSMSSSKSDNFIDEKSLLHIRKNLKMTQKKFKELKLSDTVQITITMYNILLEQIYQDMKTKGKERRKKNQYYPMTNKYVDEIRNNNEIEMDIVTCTVLLKIYGLTFNNKTIERIDNLLDEMKKKNVKPNDRFYMTLLRIYSRGIRNNVNSNDTNEWKSIYGNRLIEAYKEMEMEIENLIPNLYLYTSLHRASEFFDEKFLNNVYDKMSFHDQMKWKEKTENQQLAKRGKVRDIKKLEKETNRLLEKGWGMKAPTFETPDENNNIFLNHEEVNNLQKKGHIKSSTLEAWEKRINEDRTLLKETFEAKKPYRLKDQKRENTQYADRKGVKDHDDKNEKKDESEKDTITFY